MNPSCAEAEMPDDGLATQGAMLIAAMVLTMEEKRVCGARKCSNLP